MTERPFQTVNRLRKAGQLEEAWQVGDEAIQKTPQDAYLKGAFFWVCYEYLKQVINPINERAKKNNGNYLPNHKEMERINCLLDWVIWLNIQPGGYEYPNLMIMFQKYLEYFPQLIKFVLLHQDALFDEKGKQPFVTENGESPSLMLKCARQVAKALMLNGQKWDLPFDDVLSFLDKTREQSKDTQQKIWLDYDEAKCLIMAGREQEARVFIIPVLKRKQSESWAWGALAATYRTEDVDAAIILFSQGLCHAHDEKFALRLLIGIAPLLVNKQLPNEASMCVKCAEKCYESNGWGIKSDLQTLLNQPWHDGSVNEKLLDAFLKKRAEKAMEYLVGPTRSQSGIVVQIHDSGKGLNVYLSPNETVAIPMRFFRGGKKPKIGSHVKVIYPAIDTNIDAIAAELTAPTAILGMESFVGTLKVTEKGFGFVGDTFVPAFLVKEGMNGQEVEGIRYQQLDKKKGKLGWCAMNINFVKL